MRFRGIAVTIVILQGALLAQETNVPAQNTLAPPSQTGLQIRSVSAYATYDSSFLPNAGAGIQSTAASLPADVGIGGSIAVEWTKLTERSTFSLDYTPSYTGYIRNSNLNALNHALSLSLSRKLVPRWTFGFSVGGNLSTFEESLYAPTTLSTAAAVPSTFNDLATGLLASNYASNPQLGTALTTSPLVESPVANLVYGQRVLTSSARISLSYSYSPRLSFTFSGGGGRTQYLSGDQAPSTRTNYLISNTTSGNASVGFSYSLSPLTQLGGTVSTNRTSSSVNDAYTTTSIATLGHAFAMRWILQVHGGVGVTNTVSQASAIGAIAPTKPGPAVGGSLAYKTASNTFLGSYDRTVIDSYGLGASTTSTATAGWHWRHPGSSWWLDGSFSWQQLQGGALANTSGWHTTAGLSRAIGTHVVLLTQYVHLDYSGGLLSSLYHTTQDSVRVSIAWVPHPALQ